MRAGVRGVLCVESFREAADRVRVVGDAEIPEAFGEFYGDAVSVLNVCFAVMGNEVQFCPLTYVLNCQVFLSSLSLYTMFFLVCQGVWHDHCFY